MDGGLVVMHVHPSMAQEWRKGLRAVLYLLGLLWLFMAVATVSDIFMGKGLGFQMLRSAAAAFAFGLACLAPGVH